MNQPQPNQQQVQIKATDEKLKGDYSNMASITHNKEEFWLDFLSVFPPAGTLNARVIVSPGHFKRMVKAMEEQLKNTKPVSARSQKPASQKPASASERKLTSKNTPPFPRGFCLTKY